MSLGFGFGLPSWHTLSGGFTPASLFTGGEQGCWYDPSDYGPNGTLFTDSAGTTPVSAPGNGSDVFVGLMLDKSQGLVLGSELVTNGTFNTNLTGWAAGFGSAAGTFVWQSPGGMRGTRVSGTTSYQQGVATTIGKWYRVSADLTFVSGAGEGAIFITNASNTLAPDLGADGALPGQSKTISISFLATASTTYIHCVVGTANNTVYDFDNISVRELPGNHAFQTNSLKRPQLRARYNLLTYSEEFDNGVWQKLSNAAVDATGVLAPDGTSTADLLYPLTTGTARAVRQSVSLAAGLYTSSVAAKAAGKNFLVFGDLNSSVLNKVWFDLSNGTVGTQAAGYTGSIQPLGNGWYRCTVSNPSITPSWFYFGLSDADNSTTVTANGTDGIYIWGADLRPASQATGLIGPTYQRVAAANVYDTAGFLPYLFFDGNTWFMETNSINFSAIDKMTVWAGVRKLVDPVSDGMLCELSTTFSTSGAFYFTAPEYSAGLSYAFLSRGTAAASAGQRASTPLATYPAPITNVLAATGNIAGDLSTIRVNGVAGTSGTGDQGSGNYGNYPLYIGMRAGSTIPFNGWLTSLIIRGAQSTQSQIEATEAWVNSRTGAY